MDDILQDERFKHAKTDPRFHRMPKKKKKVVVQNRFKAMFGDKDFSTNYTEDKRGAPVKSKSSSHLEDLYYLEDPEATEELGSTEPAREEGGTLSTRKGAKKPKQKQSRLKPGPRKPVQGKKKLGKTVDYDDDSGSDSSEEDKPGASGMDLARGRVLMSSSSEESCSESEAGNGEDADSESFSDTDDTSADEESEEESEESNAEDVECTTRLAVLNLDWDRIKAVDIFFALNSFKPANGLIKSIKIYPSEFGLKRLAEERFGPPELRRDMLNSLAELRARALARRLGRASVHMPPKRQEKRSRRLLKLARKAAAAVMAEDVERGYLDEANTEHRVYEQLQKLVADSGMLSQQEMALLKDEEAKEPAAASEEAQPAAKSGKKKQEKIWDAEEKEDEKMKEKHREQLRKFQLQRLRYYYAVVECDSAQTAEHIYSQCQGREFESSAVTFNFQVIDDDEVFDQNPTDECHAIPSSYRPNFFTNAALSHVKVESTWDETDRERTKLLTKKLKKREEVNEDDLEQYIASNSDEDYLDDEFGGEAPENGSMEKEFTWNTGLKKAAAELVKKTDDKKNMTVWQQHQEKVKERRKKKRQDKKQQAQEAAFSDDEIPDGVDMDDPYFAEELNGKKSSKKKGKKKSRKEDEETSGEETEEQKESNAALELLLMEGEEEDKRHFNMREIEEAEEAEKKKRKKKRGRKQLRKPAAAEEKDDFQVDVHDPRWQTLFADADFNVEPTNPSYMDTKGSKAIIQEKHKRPKRENQPVQEHSRKRLRLS